MAAGSVPTMEGGETRPQPISEARTQELDDPSVRLVCLIRPALAAMEYATVGLFSSEPAVAAESIASAYEALSTLRYELEDQAAANLAADSRSAMAVLPTTIADAHINAEAEHMGQLARELSDIARTRRAWATIPSQLLDILRELSQVCLDAAVKAAEVVESHGTVVGAEVNYAEKVKRLLQLLYQHFLLRTVGIDVEAAVDLTFAARCYERYSEHAVAVVHRAALLAVGAPPK
jgi:phosphate transport system protein